MTENITKTEIDGRWKKWGEEWQELEMKMLQQIIDKMLEIIKRTENEQFSQSRKK